MFEIGIFSIIVLAVSYWAVLWVMGRREDVLHGEFVEGKAQPGEPVQTIVPEPSVRPIFPERPARPAFPAPPVPDSQSAQPALPAQPAFRQERLDELLNSIKQDLNQLVRK